MNVIFEGEGQFIFKGKWIEKDDDFYLDDCPENNSLTLYKKYDGVILSTNGVKYLSIKNDSGEGQHYPIDLFYTIEQWRDINLSRIGI